MMKFKSGGCCALFWKRQNYQVHEAETGPQGLDGNAPTDGPLSSFSISDFPISMVCACPATLTRMESSAGHRSFGARR